MMHTKSHGHMLVLALSFAFASSAFATDGSDAAPSATSTATASANPTATATTAPITVTPTFNSSPTSTSTSGATVTANPTATANPIVSPTISPTITGGNGTGTASATANPTVTVTPTLTGGNSAANVGNVTGGGANLSNVGNGGGATVTSNVTGTNTANLSATTGNNTNNNTLQGGDQILNNANNIAVSGGAGGHSTSNSTSTSSSTSKVENSGNSDSSSSSNVSVSNVGNPSITINNPKPLPPAANIPSVTAIAPTLFFNEGKPANATGARLAIEFLKQCPPTFDKTDVSEIRGSGTSEKTRAIFTPHSNYSNFKKEGVNPRVSVVMTPDQLPVGKYKCTCLGLLQVEAESSEASAVPIQTIITDAGLFSRDKMGGFGDVKLILIPAHAVSINLGVDANAKGFGIAPGFSGLLNSVLATIGANASNNSGRTFASAQMGATFAVVAGGEIPDGAVTIDIGAFMSALPAPTAPATPAK